MRRRTHRPDSTQAEVVAALRASGWLVWLIGRPCDALCFKAGVWRTLEIKTPLKGGGIRKRKDQPEQDEFIALTGTPRVTSAVQALKAVGSI